MTRLTERTKNMLFFFYFLAAVAYVLFWLAERPLHNFVDLILIIFIVLVCRGIWWLGCRAIELWPAICRRRVNSSRVYVEVCEPDNNPIHLIERK